VVSNPSILWHLHVHQHHIEAGSIRAKLGQVTGRACSASCAPITRVGFFTWFLPVW
jgi:hypothetical protein